MAVTMAGEVGAHTYGSNELHCQLAGKTSSKKSWGELSNQELTAR